MAVKPSPLVRAVTLLSGNQDYKLRKSAKVATASRTLLSGTSSLYTNSERQSLLSNILPSNKASDSVPESQLKSYVKGITGSISRTTADNDKILQMAPEVNQAAELVIPSIISPNDMRYGIVDIQVDADDTGIDEGLATRISSVISNHFNEELALSDNLPEWIREALYRSGAKVLMVIPPTELDRLFNDPAQLKASVESFNQKVDETLDINQSVFGIADAFRVSDSEKLLNDNDISSLSAAFESSIDDMLTSEAEAGSGKKASKSTRDASKSYNDQIGIFVKDLVGSIEVIDNPDVMKVDKLKAKRAKADIDKRIKDRYTNAPILSLDDPKDEVESIAEHPLFMELPTESVIPLYVPGTPSAHVGYFVALDEKGHPLESRVDEHQDYLEQKVIDSSKRSPFDNLFKAYGLKELQEAMGQGRGAHAMAQIYQQVIEFHIKKRAAKAGFGDVMPSTMNGIYQHLFSRYLEGRETRLLFVPAEFITYMCYRYNKNGTGRSKLEDIKFILAMRITLLIANTMAAINSSIDRRNIEVSFPQGQGAALGDPIQLLEQIRSEWISKNSMGLSIDPDAVMTTLASKGISIKAVGLPGLDGLNVTSESADRRSATPDDSLAQDIKNLLILGLDVPPSAMNSLSENEFSRSVATTSLFFARKIAQKQKHTVSKLNDFVRSYLRSSGALQREILEILGYTEEGSALKEKSEESDTKSDKGKKKPDRRSNQTAPVPDSGTVSEDSEKLTAKRLLIEVIENTTVYLPKPNIAPDRTQFENFEAFVTSITNAVDNLFGDDLVAGDPQAASALASVRAHAKTGMLRRYLKVMGFGEDLEFPELRDLVGSDQLDIRQFLINLQKGIDDLKHLNGNDAEDDTGGSGGGYPFN